MWEEEEDDVDSVLKILGRNSGQGLIRDPFLCSLCNLPYHIYPFQDIQLTICFVTNPLCLWFQW